MSQGFKRSVYWNKYKVIPDQKYDENDYIRELLDASYQGVKRQFVLAYRDRGGANGVTADSHIEINGRNSCDQPINDLIKQYDEVRKISREQCDDCTTGCLLDFTYFKKKITD